MSNYRNVKRKLMVEKMLRKETNMRIFVSIIICSIIVFTTLFSAVKNVESTDNSITMHASAKYMHNSEPITKELIEVQLPYADEDSILYEALEAAKTYIYDDISEEDGYLLAKMAMAEAEGCSIETKVHVILTILNRVNDKRFPNTVKGVIYEKNASGVYQFSPVCNGRWNKVEPNEDCWKALEIVKTLEEDISVGSLFFESCVDENNWHSNNLILLYQLNGMRFYK